MALILCGHLELMLFGVIRYHDTFNGPSVWQDFCFRYKVLMFDAQTFKVEEDLFFAGPDKNNRYHQKRDVNLLKTNPQS